MVKSKHSRVEHLAGREEYLFIGFILKIVQAVFSF